MKIKTFPLALMLILAFSFHLETVCGQSLADTLITEKTIEGLFRLQHYFLPEEKVHVHTDRNYYISGDTIRLRGYIVNAARHTRDTTSRHLYVDLVTPDGLTYESIKIHRRNGIYEGYIPLRRDARSGYYSLRAYTLFMRNSGEEFYFQAPIRIVGKNDGRYRMDARLGRKPDSKVLPVSIWLWDTILDTVPDLKRIDMGISGTRMLDYLRFDDREWFKANLRLQNPPNRESVLIDIDGSRRYIEVPPPPELFDVSFFPEGGHLLAGTPCTIGFKALNSYGMGENVTGKIIDQKGTEVAAFDSEYKGMGSFLLIPQAGATYSAECTNDKGYTRRFSLPAVRNDALALRVQRKDRFFIAAVAAPAGTAQLPALTLLVHTRGVVQSVGEIGKRPVYVDLTTLPSGISSFVLLDEQRNVLSERLVFCLNDDMAHSAISTNKGSYAKREKASVAVELKDKNGKPLQGTFSVAVTNNTVIPSDTIQNILTDLLLTSDIKGYVESPAWYFSGAPEAFACLDHLMLTQGWKRYDVPNLLQGKLKREDPNLEIIGAGTVKKWLIKTPAANNDVVISARGMLRQEVLKTDKQGRFRIPGMDVPMNVTYRLQAMSKLNNNYIELHIDDLYTPTYRIPAPSEAYFVDSLTPKNRSRSSDTYLTWEDSMQVTFLGALAVTPQKEKRRTFDEEYFHSNGIKSYWNFLQSIHGELILIPENTPLLRDDRLTAGHAPGNMAYIIDGKIMSKGFDYERIDMKQVRSIGVSDKAFGQPMETPDPYSGRTFLGDDDFTKQDAIDAAGVYYDVFPLGDTPITSIEGRPADSKSKSSKPTEMGDDVAGQEYEYADDSETEIVAKSFVAEAPLDREGGVFFGGFFITTKNGYINDHPYKGVNRRLFGIPGYQQPVEFYAPKYETTQEKASLKEDMRNTLYWNPAVKAGDDGKASFHFYTADHPATYSIIVEGVTDDGKIIRETKKIYRD